MKIRFLWVFILWPAVILAQAGFDLTGRVSLRVQQTAYNQDSRIKPDSIAGDQYGLTTLIPGLQQTLNISLFGRTRELDFTFLADLKNNEWNQLNLSTFNSIPRMTLYLHWNNQDLIAGDFFDSYDELFILSREVRGGKYKLQVNDVWGKNSRLEMNILGGMVQKAVAVGNRTTDLYKQFETAGQYRRWMGAGIIKIMQQNYFDLTLNYLHGRDQKSSIDTSLNDPLQNNVYGGSTNIYLWNNNIRLFAEFNQSFKDTLKAGQGEDEAYYGGVDFRYRTFNLIILYEKLGPQYFTVGYPYLENDKRGVKGKLDYAFPNIIIFNTDFEIYKDNLDKQLYQPTASITLLNAGFTTLLKQWPELTLRYGLRTDLSKTIQDAEDQPYKTDKTTTKLEGRIAFDLERNRFSVSAIKLNLQDHSLLGTILPLSTNQFISSLTFYSSALNNLFLTAGAVYSYLRLSDGQKNTNLYIYETNRWNIIPRRLLLESTVTAISNDASGAGTQDVLNDYFTVLGEVSFEYFFSDKISFKVIMGTDNKIYKYTLEQARQIIADPDYGPTYFNGAETYRALIFGGEINWIF